jgi:hypothetical protein
MSKHPTSEFERELIRATIRACGVNPPESQDYDAIIAEAIKRTNEGPDWPFTLVVYREEDDCSTSYIDIEPFAQLPEALRAIGAAIHRGADPDQILLFHGQPLDLSSFHAEREAAIAAEEARMAEQRRLQLEKDRAMRDAAAERHEREMLARLKAKYEKPT